MESVKLVELVPVEFRVSGHPKGRRYEGFAWYTDIKISRHLDQNVIDRIIDILKTKKRVSTCNNPDNLLMWQYQGKPLIIIDLNESSPKVKTTIGTLKHFGLMECCRQAGIVLQILKKYHYAKYRKVVISTYRLGTSKKKRAMVMQLIHEWLQKLEQSTSKVDRRG